MIETRAFKVLSDETKMRILNLLVENECCVCEVMQALEIPQYKASRGLINLHEAGFLNMRKDRLWVFYSLDKQGLTDYRLKLVEAVREALKDNAVTKLDKERLKKAVRVGAGCHRGRGKPEPHLHSADPGNSVIRHNK
ncbi:MAG: winged helix-turn-helix transcriptional regulator [Dehalococcoidaceae bacterium]|nr:winged helix-turn-helix transcriptional regulator [Dehalococcoidaceae bacterium]